MARPKKNLANKVIDKAVSANDADVKIITKTANVKAKAPRAKKTKVIDLPEKVALFNHATLTKPEYKSSDTHKTVAILFFAACIATIITLFLTN